MRFRFRIVPGENERFGRRAFDSTLGQDIRATCPNGKIRECRVVGYQVDAEGSYCDFTLEYDEA